jgi:hypothetical protein
MRSIHARVLALVLAALCAGCGSEAPARDLSDRPVLPTLIDTPPTCRTALEGSQVDDQQLRQQAEFDSLVACETGEHWVDVGVETLADDREALGARLEELCESGGLRHAETPVCRSLS